MFLQRANLRGKVDGGGGGWSEDHQYAYHQQRQNHFSGLESTSTPPVTSTSRQNNTLQRSFPSTTASSFGHAMISAAGNDHRCSVSSSPPPSEASWSCAAGSPPLQSPTKPSRTAEALPGKASLGVFLQNCHISGDFVQLKQSDTTAINTHVRLYLTATELVKKTAIKSKARGPGATDGEFNIARYPLRDVLVSRSKVSPYTTLVVSLLQSQEASEDEKNHGGDLLTSTTSNVGASTEPYCVSRTISESPSRHGPAENNGPYSNGSVRCYGSATDDAVRHTHGGKRIVSVDAYRLRGDLASSTISIDDWISRIETNRRKLDMLQRLRQSSISTNSQTSTMHESDPSIVPPPLSPTRGVNGGTTTSHLFWPKHSSPPGVKWIRERESEVGTYQRQSSSGFDIANTACGSPTREKFSNTTNGRYTPLHHHYSIHPLTSNSQQPHQNGHIKSSSSSSSAAAVQLRQRKNPKKGLLRRLSLGTGLSGTYHFPPSPVDPPSSTADTKTIHSRKNGTTKYMYSLSQDPSTPPSSTTPLNMSPTASTARKLKDSSPQRQSKGNGTATSWKQRRSIFSRSISDYSHDSLNLSETEGADEDGATRPITIMQQRSTPLPDSTTSGDVDGIKNQVNLTNAGDDNVPLELKALQSFLTSIASSSGNHPPSNPNRPPLITQQLSSCTSHSTQSDHEREEDGDEEEEEEEEEEAGFQSFLRHKQIRGRKIHISPRVPSAEISAELLSPPSWMDKFPALPPVSSPSPSPSSSTPQPSEREGKIKAGNSSTLPRGHRLKTDSSGSNGRTSRTLDREGSNSPVAKTATSSKAPKLFKRFHRRWQSSSGVKLELEMIPPPPTPDASLLVPFSSSGFSQPTVTADREKLYLLPPREVAEGLTKMDAELLRHINPDEITDGAWMKRGQKEKLAPNILAMVHSFNQLALLIPTEVLGERTAQQRAKVISAYIQIASKCYYLKNFNSLKAILAGLQSTPVHRLRKTWKDIQSKKRKRFDRLCRLMSEDNNWELYRNELDKCLNSNVPCIPYLGQFLTQVCHQLSYDKMKAERDEVKDRRRSQSVLGAVEENNLKEKRVRERGNFRRRSKSFHKGSRCEERGVGKVLQPGTITTTTTSLSTPVSPIASEDESDPSKPEEDEEEEEERERSLDEEETGGRMIVKQLSGRGLCNHDDDTQSLEFSLELDDRDDLHLPMSQPDTFDTVVPLESPEKEDADVSKSRAPGKRRLVRKRTIPSTFHSTPVKDANGYFKPLCSPVKLNFDRYPLDLGYDEPDFNEPLKPLHIINPAHDPPTIPGGYDMETREWEKDEKMAESYRVKIPSISLQQTSSHSSLDHDWDEEEEEVEEEEHVGGGRRRRRVINVAQMTKISKSRSLDSNLNISMRAVSGGRERNGTADTLIHLTPSHSIPSLDSDSVFSAEEEQREREREGEEEKETERKLDQVRARVAEEKNEEEEEERRRLLARHDFLQIRMLENSSFERSMDSEFSTDSIIETSNTNSTIPLSTSSTVTTTNSPTTNPRLVDTSIDRPSEFSPATSFSSSELYIHSREQSLDNSLITATRRENCDASSSSSPAETQNPEQDLKSSTSHTKDSELLSKVEPVKENNGKKKRKKKNSEVQRSKSTSGSGNYRYKWRWKKAIALNSNHTHSTNTTSHSPPPPPPPSSILNSANPFHLLQIYKDRSGDCLSSYSSRTDFRVILNRFNSNTETQNYELSFEREP